MRWNAAPTSSDVGSHPAAQTAGSTLLTDGGYSDLSTRDCPTTRLIEAEDRCELLTVLVRELSMLSPVSETDVWLFEPSQEQFEPAGPTDEADSPPAMAVDAFETGETQYAVQHTSASKPTTSTDDTAESGGETATEIDVAHPLGTVGVVSVRLETLTPTVRETLGRLLAVAEDGLERNRTYAQLEAQFQDIADRNRLLSQFARTVAHDLNSPLSVIYGRIELSLAEPSNTEIHLQAAKNAAKRVDSLITDHLQTIEAADMASKTEAVSIQTVAIEAWRIIDPPTARFQVDPPLGLVEANATRLQQLFENLIRNSIEHGLTSGQPIPSNSIKHGFERPTERESTPEKKPHTVFDDDFDSVTVTIKPTATGFAVCDDGPGIPAERRDRIFDSGYTTTDSGSGLGLHIVKEIVDAHDWEITVAESKAGGARFEVVTE